MSRRVVIVAGGWIKGPSLVKTVIREGDFLIAADGGLRHLVKAGILPDLLMGDLDSLPRGMRRWAEEKGIRILAHPREKDDTDTELAVRFALSMDPAEILILGGIGDRIDHTLSNLGLLLQGLKRKVPMRILDGRQVVFLTEDRIEIQGRVGDWVSLLPFSERVSGITTAGLKFPLADGSLVQGHSLGISNELIASKARIRIRSGILAVVHVPKS